MLKLNIFVSVKSYNKPKNNTSFESRIIQTHRPPLIPLHSRHQYPLIGRRKSPTSSHASDCRGPPFGRKERLLCSVKWHLPRWSGLSTTFSALAFSTATRYTCTEAGLKGSSQVLFCDCEVKQLLSLHLLQAGNTIVLL